MSSSIFSLLLTTVLVFAVPPAFGAFKNLGVVGETYQIVEPDVVVKLRQQAATRNRSNNDEFLERIKTYQPADIIYLPRATVDKTFLVDMTYTLERDLMDGNGKVIYPKGFTFNPLNYVSFPGGVLIINGDDPSQLNWFNETPYAENHQVRLLLSGGFAHELTEQIKRSVFYLTDIIAKRLQLAAVPSLVIQKGDKLEVREFLVTQKEKVDNAIR